jgi:DNA-directed RNA polymerase subunit H (RpoH/RPB5)
MSHNLRSIELTRKEVIETLITNLIKMLANRGILKQENIKNNIANALKNISINNVFTVVSDKDNSKWNIILSNVKITSLNKSNVLIDFISEDSSINKIVIFKYLTKRIYSAILEYPNVEVFFEWELMETIIENDLIPKHIHYAINTPEHTEIVESLNDKLLSLIFTTDRICRYYNMKSGDIVCVHRPSMTAGYNIFHRKVVNGSYDTFFAIYNKLVD